MYSSNPQSAIRNPQSAVRIPVVLLLLAFFAQALTSVSVMAPTFDEEFHVARAYAYVRTGDLRMQQNHPPLVSVLAGLPLLLMPELTPPEQIPRWERSSTAGRGRPTALGPGSWRRASMRSPPTCWLTPAW
jgi:hypothetical protein